MGSLRDRLADFWGAVGFLTILPTGAARFRPERMVGFFPLVGLFVGGIVAGVDFVARFVWPEPLVAVLVVLVFILLTGALHVDGLADAGDGLFSHRSRERILEIMKDSRVGVMGVVSLMGVLALKWGGVLALSEDRLLALVLVPGYSRLGMLVGMRWLPYGRPEGGTGAPFCVPNSLRSMYWSVGILLPLSLLLGWKGVALNVFFAVACAGILALYSRVIGCITGDTLGAMNEVLEAGLLLFLAVKVW
ncbi:MAG: adenosylcobinamide-GDP ribazoletransferase [Desulfovermiculus sp.]|nr:adenosylcobinamide-GDP ribazoletransferase [Desulfovermiculus sp.]